MATSFTKETKPTTSKTKESKPTTSFTKEDKSLGFLLKEDAAYLLLETGMKIIIGGLRTTYTKESKP